MSAAAVPEALLTRYRASVDKDAALVELATLKAVQIVADDVARKTRQLMHLVAANEPRLAGATLQEIGGVWGLSTSSVSEILIKNRGQTDWQKTQGALILDITAGSVYVGDTITRPGRSGEGIVPRDDLGDTYEAEGT